MSNWRHTDGLLKLKKRVWTELSKCIRMEASDEVGWCTCVTCGYRAPWNSGEIHAGHFLDGRRNSILFEEQGIHPQCQWCNNTTPRTGSPWRASDRQGDVKVAYTQYMLERYGKAVVERLQHLKQNVSISFTREDLLAKYDECKARQKKWKKKTSS